MRAILPILILSAAPVLVHGQAIIEYGATAGSTAGAAAGVGKSVKGVFGQLNKTLAGAAKADEAAKLATAPSPVIPASGAPAASAQAAPAVPADFSEIVAGMDKADLLKKAGKPSMSVTSMESSALVETCWYRAGDDRVTVILRNGKVATISGGEKSASK
jgi:hypothetical protein